MMDGIDFRLNHSTADDIAAHLAACDADFVAPLSRRTRVADYAAKLARLTERFEAWAGEELAGLVAAYCNEPEKRTAFISSVSVAPNWRGAGIGDRLIESCLGHAAALGFVRVELRVATANAAALRLYARHGFRPCGQEGEEITMLRELSPPDERNGKP
jgi:ribosomal protein S18 acetylase RimI-like enzyme